MLKELFQMGQIVQHLGICIIVNPVILFLLKVRGYCLLGGMGWDKRGARGCERRKVLNKVRYGKLQDV